jgi:chromosome segregation protein
MQDIDHEQCSLDARLAELERESRELTTRRERLAGQRDAAVFESDESRAAPLRTALAANEERLRVLSLAAQSAGERVVATSTTIESRESEAARIRDDLAGNGHERATLDTENERTEALLGERRAALEPCQQERAEIVVAVGAAEQALDRATEALRQAERERDRTTLGLARVQDEQVFLVERMRNDLDLHDPSSLDDLPDEDAPDEQEIERLRERLRRMSVVGDDVVELFDAESQRLAFLSDQLRDVDDAAAGLRQVLAQLNTSMAERFDATFRDVRTSFETTFTRLFGGGSAQLVMQQADDGSAGIDIVAQPPGKRLQHLNALSGGERALTAVALLIAIQRVNPSPFCMLDEVDAALDESNVVRFRDEIRDLSGATQFVLITHNRGTIEGADTLYGVTMGDDGISRVVSLRLADAIVAVEAFEAARAAGD